MKPQKIVLGIVLLLFLVIFASAVLIQRVPPASIGVKQSQWGGGIESADYETGFHVGVTGIHKWYLLDKRTHFLTFADSQAVARRRGIFKSVDFGRSRSERNSLEIRTRDGNTALIDVTVTYKIKKDEGHKIVQKGLRDVYPDRVSSTVEGLLRGELAQLSSEDFYSTETRLQRAQATLAPLTAALEPLHVAPETILIRAVKFPEDYERTLQDKQLTQQKKLLAVAQKKVEEELAKTGKLEKEIEAREKETRGEWDKTLEQARSDLKVELAEITGEALRASQETRANADADYETRIAEGKLALDKAEAIRNELRNQALDTTGGSIFLARQAAENLNIESVTLNSNDPDVPTIIDIPALVELLVGRAKEGE